jgi:diguanylate cyclase (GGDEF)-like protein
MFRHLRTRIAVFFVALLVLVQITALIAVNAANSTNARQKIDGELGVGERIFGRLLEQNRDRLVQATRILAADFAFREAIATNDLGTVLSALQNHGDRINANAMMLVSLDGSVLADTLSPDATAHPFYFPDLLKSARAGGSASSIELLQNHAYQLVVVPVLAPLPIAWVAVGLTVDDALAAELRQLTSLEVSFLRRSNAGSWHVLATTLDDGTRQQLLGELPALPAALELKLVGSDESEQQLRVIELHQPGGTEVVAVLQRSVATAIAAFDKLRVTLVALAVFSLLLSVAGSIAISRGITRPLSELAGAAVRIQKGDYVAEVSVAREDEIGVLASSLDQMRSGIALREQEILRLAYRDALTGLPNRVLFNLRLEEALVIAAKMLSPLAVLMMDLDRFKHVNEALGHRVGDHVLKEVAARLQGLLRAEDTVARLGGDEFAVLLPHANADYAAGIAHKILRALEQPIDFEGQPLDVGGSIGIAHYPEHGADAGALLRDADIAMYVAKGSNGGFAVFDAKYDTHQQEHLSMLSELRRAVEQNELAVFYQPKASLSTSSVGAVEALLRWVHPVRGFVSPGEFIPFAEQTGYIKVLTRWVLEESIRQCGEWLALGKPLQVSVNISARDLTSRELPEFVGSLLDRYAVPAELLCIEITESGIMEDPAQAQGVLDGLHALGIHLAIDDYGTGYSSLSYVVRLPVDELKIDRSFVMGMVGDPTMLTVVRSTIELGHNLGLRVVAEGVEDEATLDLLRELGCDQAQGYFLSRPVSAAKLEEWLAGSAWGRGQLRKEPDAGGDAMTAEARSA